MRTELFIVLVSLVGAALSYLTLREHLQNAKLKKKLRRALVDCVAFHNLEQVYCDLVVDGSMRLFSPNASANSVKRYTRSVARQRGLETPSGEANPQKLMEEIAKL